MTQTRKARANEITIAEIADSLAQDAASVAEEIIGERPSQRSGRELRFYPKGGLRVHISGPKRGRWKDYGPDESGDLIDLYQYIYGCSKGEAVKWAKGRLGIVEATQELEIPQRDREAEKREIDADLAKRKRTASFLWRTAKPARDTVAEAYLRARGITCELPACVGYRHLDATAMEKMGLDKEHPGPLDAAAFKAVSLDGEVQAVQQVIIDPASDGPKKAEVSNKKRTNGVMIGAAVHLGEPDDEVILAEGPETGLSVWQALGIPTWIVLGTYNFTQIELPERVKRVVIAVDIEESGAGLSVAVAAAGEWQARGKQVALMIPDVLDGDFNDVLKDDGPEAIRAAYDSAIESERQPETDACLILRSPWDALAAWRSTGVRTRATVKPLAPYRDLEEVGRAIIVGEPGEPVDLQDWKPSGDQTLFEITTSKLSISQIHAYGGGEAVTRLLRMAAPLGKRFFYGLEAAALKADAPVVVVHSRRELIAARRLLPSAAVLAHRADDPGADGYHWRPLAGRRVILAPANSERGHAQAARAAQLLHEIGARDVRMLIWPLCRRTATGWRQFRRQIPEGYGFVEAARQDWSAANAGELLEMAEPLPAPAAEPASAAA